MVTALVRPCGRWSGSASEVGPSENINCTYMLNKLTQRKPVLGERASDAARQHAHINTNRTYNRDHTRPDIQCPHTVLRTPYATSGASPYATSGASDMRGASGVRGARGITHVSSESSKSSTRHGSTCTRVHVLKMKRKRKTGEEMARGANGVRGARSITHVSSDSSKSSKSSKRQQPRSR